MLAVGTVCGRIEPCDGRDSEAGTIATGSVRHRPLPIISCFHLRVWPRPRYSKGRASASARRRARVCRCTRMRLPPPRRPRAAWAGGGEDGGDGFAPCGDAKQISACDMCGGGLAGAAEADQAGGARMRARTQSRMHARTRIWPLCKIQPHEAHALGRHAMHTHITRHKQRRLQWSRCHALPRAATA